METEIAELSRRVLAPVTSKLPAQELENAGDGIRRAFERQLDTRRTTADTEFEGMAVNILEPVRSELCEADFTRIVDRLRGAMAGFCQCDRAKVQPDAEPWGFQQAGQSDLQQNALPDSDMEPWWSTSERAMALLILLWLCAAVDWQLR